MEISCSVKGCRSRGYGDNEEVLFFPMPLNDLPKLNKWLAAIRDDDFIPSIDSYICSKHFIIKDFAIPDNCEPRLKTTAIPSVFPKHTVMKEETITIIHEPDETKNEIIIKKEVDKNLLMRVPNSMDNSNLSTFRLTLVPSSKVECNSNTLDIHNGIEYFDKRRIQEEEEKLRKKIKVMHTHLKMQDSEITRLKGILQTNSQENMTESLLDILENH